MNAEMPEETKKEQQLLNTPINEGEITENKTEQVPTEKVCNSVEIGTGESTQQVKTALQPELTENQPSELQPLSERKEFFNSIQNELKSIPEGFETSIAKIDIVSHLSDLQKVLTWLENLKIGNKPNDQDIDKVVILISLTNKLLGSDSSIFQKNENLQEKVPVLEKENKIREQYTQYSTNYQQNYNQQLSINYQIKQENIKLKKDNDCLRQENEQLSKKNKGYARQIQSYQQQQQYLLQLEDEIRKSEEKYNILKNERDELVRERGIILSNLAAQKRDKTTTYTTSISGDAKPQHHILYQEFKQLKDQEFNAVSNKIFDYLSKQSLALKSNRKQEIAKIKSIFSEKVIINGIKLFAGNSDFSPGRVENAMKVIRLSFHSALGIVEDSEISETLSNELENLIRQGINLVNKTSSTDTIARLWNEEEFTKAVKDISRSVYIALQMPEETNISEEIRANTDNLVRKGLELVKKIASVDPPGNLWMEQKGTLFKYENHEAMLGCEESGKILLTVYPGYTVGNRIFEKALVFTAQEE